MLINLKKLFVGKLTSSAAIMLEKLQGEYRKLPKIPSNCDFLSFYDFGFEIQKK